MKTKNILFYSAILFASVNLVSCDDSIGDNVKPTIENISIAHGKNSVAAGEDLCIEMEVADNIALSYLKIDMHHNLSCGGVKHETNTPQNISYIAKSDDHDHGHGHDHDTAWEMSEDAEGFHTLNKTLDLTGKKNSHIHQHVEIPSVAYNGDYHILIYLVDAEGNETYVAKEVEVTSGTDYDGEGHDH